MTLTYQNLTDLKAFITDHHPHQINEFFGRGFDLEADLLPSQEYLESVDQGWRLIHQMHQRVEIPDLTGITVKDWQDICNGKHPHLVFDKEDLPVIEAWQFNESFFLHWGNYIKIIQRSLESLQMLNPSGN